MKKSGAWEVLQSLHSKMQEDSFLNYSDKFYDFAGSQIEEIQMMIISTDVDTQLLAGIIDKIMFLQEQNLVPSGKVILRSR